MPLLPFRHVTTQKFSGVLRFSRFLVLLALIFVAIGLLAGMSALFSSMIGGVVLAVPFLATALGLYALAAFLTILLAIEDNLRLQAASSQRD
ncbi:hypothetical protein QWI17_15510 [Gilvimarinus sp. SDUM040013]|uniref:Uncharacterized protein n=1 Tax=Gilvimarinus gilvus TaxID=3058038 RepID=A0ABU4RVP3_9GAMM|nr:hypothetical protein [Gilvimarinus sp. SDUM040013]MDO3387249.1 hypothetical protein [Gilvimarinus sp. SDUM040013]MDX6848938.1 hypothetical protein [Gilvimarinus sp. SDUM040013]